MEVKINREIRDYTESLFFGLSLRQCVYTLLALAVAGGIYLLLRPVANGEIISWLCILGAAPFVAMGFLKWHGMTAGRFLMVWFRSRILEPKFLPFQPASPYGNVLREREQGKKKKHRKR